MKLQILPFFFFSLFLFTSCENEELASEWVDVTVVSQAVDCRQNWIMKYDNPISQDGFDSFQEIGMPSEYKTEGQKLKLRIRDPKKEESFPCTTLGVSYPFKVILEAKRK